MKDRILVVGGMGCNRLMSNIGEVTNNIKTFMGKTEQFKLVFFTGGEDVSPKLYGHTSPKGYCGYNTARDMEEMGIFSRALVSGIPCAGLCRGFQFLNVMAGGTMIHHASNHSGGYHNIRTINDELIEVNSLHHQMVIPPEKNSEVVAWSEHRLSSLYYGDKDIITDKPDVEVEAAVFTKINSLGVQWHPEYLDNNERGCTWFIEFINSYIERKYNNLAGG